jgi:acetyl esterase/lipase
MKSIMLALFATVAVASAEWLLLWPGEAPGGTKPQPIIENVRKTGSLTNIAVPQYKVRLPETSKRTGAAMIILPGETVIRFSRWIMRAANTRIVRGARYRLAVICKYRVSGKDEAGYHFPVPLMDARRAIRVTRSKAMEWGIDPEKVGVMESSAGHHLACMCATLWEEKLKQETNDAIDALDCRPDFAALVHPMVTMTEARGHGGSKRGLRMAARLVNSRSHYTV